MPLHDVPPAEALQAWFDELALAGGGSPVATETVSLLEAAGRVAARTVHARHADPIARCAAMDGIATLARHCAGASSEHPVRLGPGQFAPIDTGQALLDPWDTIVPSEQLEHAGGDSVLVHAAAPAGRHVRRAGENVDAGAAIISAGRRLTAYDIALAIACGHSTVLVHARPRVVVIPTGDEIRPIGSELAAGESIDANSAMLAILLQAAGAEVTVTPIVPDRPNLLERQLDESSRAAELVLVIAGSARGTRDQTAAVLERCGSIVVRGIALRPAHPVILGRLQTVAVVGMPGYPMSTAFAFERFARPLLEQLSGEQRAAPTTQLVRLASSVCGRLDAEVQVPVTLTPVAGDLATAHPGSRHGSALASLAQADAVISIPAGVELLEAGSLVDAVVLPASQR